jgi:hypothetical protein
MLACWECRSKLGRVDVLEEQSRQMEAARRVFDLKGLHFRYYCCSSCGHDNVFLVLIALPGETTDEMRRRRTALEMEIDGVRAWRTTVVVL